MAKRKLEVKGMLIHVSHYDPTWCEVKAKEEKFDADVALELVELLAAKGFNLLVVDCADGVRYKSHPELRRHYTVAMKELRKVAEACHRAGIDVCPKLNFAKSGRNFHDDWLRPHSHPRWWLKDPENYWQTAADLVCELVQVCEPERFFHVGMDEDHYRSVAQYVDAVKTLRGIVRAHRLRTVIWNDSCHDRLDSLAQVHAEKCRAAEKDIPKDVVQVPWCYGSCHSKVVKRLGRRGFEVWGAPGRTLAQARAWRRAILANGGKGLLLTWWVKCSKRNRRGLLKLVRDLSPAYR
jgi:hypothetical protein